MASEGPILDNWCRRVRDAALLAYDQINPALLESPLVDISYAIKGRVKAKSKMFGKVLRKRVDLKNPRPEYEPKDITDACAFRIVTLFHRDIIEATHYLLKMVNHDEAVARSPFLKRGVREIRIFTSRPEGDPLSVSAPVLEVVGKAGHAEVCRKPEASDTGYSSIHLILDTPVDFEIEINEMQPEYPLPTEFQIRSVFEDAWGEIDHKLRYSENRNISGHTYAASSWQPHLNALKTFVDGCDQHADVIRSQALETRTRERVVLPYIPFETVQHALQAFSTLEEALQIRLRSAYAARERLEAATLEKDRIRAALDMVDRFELIERDYGAFLSAEREESRELLYNVRMEQAFGMLSTGQSNAFERAIHIYSEIIRDYPQAVVPIYRLGQTYYENRQYKLASKCFADAGKRLQRTSDIPKQHWLRSSCPRMQALALWRQSQTLPQSARGRQQRRKLLLDAYNLAKAAVEAAESGSDVEVLARNSVLYYGVEYLALCATQKELGEIDLAFLKKTLAILAASVDLSTTTQLRALDTMCRAHRWFKNITAAKQVAERVVTLIEALEPGLRDSDDLEMLRYARETLALGGPSPA